MLFKHVTLAAVLLGAVSSEMRSYEATLANIPEDGRLNFTDLSSKYKHPAIEHTVTTTDGYILKMFNLPGDRGSCPLLFVHGVFGTSDGWIIRGNDSLAIMAANEGHDVWVANFRGNKYARKHTSLDPDKDAEFWNYSVNEYGIFDLSATIDYVLNATGRKQVCIVGFSEGTTATVVLGSSKPEYNKKVKIFIALAPVVFLEHARPLLSIIIKWSPLIDLILPKSIQEVAGHYTIAKAIINLLCTQLPIGYEICYQGGVYALSGADPYGIERDFFPTVIGHFPDGSSRKNLLHFAQIGLKKSFAKYDYGAAENFNKYRSFTPPEYDLSKMTMDTVLASGLNDPVSTMKDVAKLYQKLPSVVKHIVVEDEFFSHLDHMWAKNAPALLYKEILKILADSSGI